MSNENTHIGHSYVHGTIYHLKYVICDFSVAV